MEWVPLCSVSSCRTVIFADGGKASCCCRTKWTEGRWVELPCEREGLTPLTEGTGINCWRRQFDDLFPTDCIDGNDRTIACTVVLYHTGSVVWLSRSRSLDKPKFRDMEGWPHYSFTTHIKRLSAPPTLCTDVRALTIYLHICHG